MVFYKFVVELLSIWTAECVNLNVQIVIASNVNIADFDHSIETFIICLEKQFPSSHTISFLYVLRITIESRKGTAK